MLANRNVRLLVLGQFISAIGDHFYLIALPWLGLQITGSAFVAGTLLAVASVPRSVFMLLGGAVTDRYSA
jgi:MFS family permease